MTIRSGARLGAYEILSAIGAGGMGEVWKARDSLLRRQVAIKTLPAEMAHDANRLARLEREAELLASLNHPNIAVIHGLEEHDGTRFLVLELVEGETLEDRLRRGPLSIKQSLQLALQIAEALEAAHERGVVHRDLKPANIKVTPDGRIKVLDFGLAKAAESDSPALTGTAVVTQPGVVVGTPAYMAPEQARGESAGPQADIWSFGAVLYELLTGTSPFRQNTTAETLARLLGAEPDLSILPADTPSSVRRLIQRCLEKERKRRAQHIGDVRIEIEEALVAPHSAALQHVSSEFGASRRWIWRVMAALAAIGVAGLGGWLFGARNGSAPPAIAAHVSIPFFERRLALPFGTRKVAVSADGSRIAYSASTRLMLRQIDNRDPVAIPEVRTDPFFSPDGRWVGGFDAGYGLFKAPIDGGPPIRLAATSARPAGATWGKDRTIVFATSEGVFSISEDGGEARLLVKPDIDQKETLYAWPRFLPGDRSVLLTVVREGQPNTFDIAVLELTTLQKKTLLKGGSSAQFVETGHLIYAGSSTLKAVRFDPKAQQVLGDPVTFADLDVATAADNGAADFGLSDAGTLAFMSQAAVPGTLRTLQWIDRKGQRQPVAIEPGSYGYPRLSPDGHRVSLEMTRGGNRDIWILDLDRVSLSRLTDAPTEDLLSGWNRDGQRVFFSSNRSGNFDIYSQPADGATGARLELARPGTQMLTSITPDGQQLIMYEDFKDLLVLDIGHPESVRPLLNGAANERLGSVSPDGRWLVYESDEAGKQIEIFVRPYPNVGDRREKISVNGGRFPRWGPRGSDEMYFVNLDGEMMAASVKLSPTLTVGAVTKLFDYQKPPAGVSGIPYDVSSDGRFFTAQTMPSDTTAPTQVSVVLNWLDELKQRVLTR